MGVMRGLLLAVAACFAGPAAALEDITLPSAQFADVVQNRDVSFRARNIATGHTCTLEGSNLEAAHAPWSTFKIPNLLIALEVGAAMNLLHVRGWDPERRPAAPYWPATWGQDHTLKSAFQTSAVWYFQDLALEITSDEYHTILQRWNYGNAKVSEGRDDFWLNKGLEISVEEQVRFLTRLLRGDLEVSRGARMALEEASLASEVGKVTLHGKTGGGYLRPDAVEGWYVGWVATDRAPQTAFALYTTADRFDQIRKFRKDFAMTLLKACRSLPADMPD